MNGACERANVRTGKQRTLLSLPAHQFMHPAVLGLAACRQPEQAQAGGRDPDPLARFWPSCRLGQSGLEGYGRATAARASLRMADKTTGDT